MGERKAEKALGRSGVRARRAPGTVQPWLGAAADLAQRAGPLCPGHLLVAARKGVCGGHRTSQEGREGEKREIGVWGQGTMNDTGRERPRPVLLSTQLLPGALWGLLRLWSVLALGPVSWGDFMMLKPRGFFVWCCSFLYWGCFCLLNKPFIPLLSQEIFPRTIWLKPAP